MDHLSQHRRPGIPKPMRALMLGAVALVAACSSTVPEPTRAFLAQDLPLTAAGTRGDVRTYRKPGFDAASYTAVILRPAEFSGGASSPLSPEAKTDLARRLDAEMARAFGQRLKVTDKPGPGVLEVRSAVTAVGEPRKVLNAVTMAVLFVPATKGGAAIEAEVIELGQRRGGRGPGRHGHGARRAARLPVGRPACTAGSGEPCRHAGNPCDNRRNRALIRTRLPR